MKPTKVRNQQIYQASFAQRSKQTGSPLSKELRKKYGKRGLRVIVDDSVRVIRGEYKGVDGKVTKVSTENNSVAIEGIKREKLKGEKIDVFIPCSNVMITNLNLDDHWRKSLLEGKRPKTTPKEAKPEKVEKPKEAKPEKVEKPKEEKPEAKPEKPKEEKPKESKPEKVEKPKTEKPKGSKQEKSKTEKPKGDTKAK